MSIKKIQLEVCPFCGKYPSIEIRNGFYYIECCFIRRFGYKKTAKELVDIWNNRMYNWRVTMINYRISHNEVARKKGVVKAPNRKEAIQLFCKKFNIKKIDNELLDCQIITNEEYEEEKSWK